MNKVVLLFTHYFFPAQRAGGTPKSILNLVQQAGSQLQFRIITSNQEHGGAQKLSGIKINEWLSQAGYQICYLTSGLRNLVFMGWEICRWPGATIYFNSFFDPRYTILPLLFAAAMTRKKIVLAPRGEFSAAALSLKSSKKKIWIGIFKLLRLQHRIYWQACSEKEKIELQNFWPNIKVTVLEDLPDAQMPAVRQSAQKTPGQLRLVFLARIAPIKNLHLVLEALMRTQSKIELDIFGPIEDANYWQRCQGLIQKMPANIHCHYQGALNPGQVSQVLRGYEVYILLSGGENFGHSIFEALSASLPVIVSDQTPWRDLQRQGVGFDLPLENLMAVTQAIEHFASLNQGQLNEYQLRSHAYAAASLLQQKGLVQRAIQLFN